MAGVRFERVTKRFDHTVVERMDLEAREGEFVVLVGPSGCGKSTSLRMLAGLESVTEGRIRIGDRDVTDMHPKDRNVAMVFQDYALYPHMSVEENMALGLRVKKLPKDEIEKRVSDAARILELEPLMAKRPGQLSGGQRQRVAMGRAIVKSPEVYLFDEPLSNLDAKLRSQLRVEITRLHRLVKKTVFYVTHDQVEAMTLGDTIAVMHEGRIQQIGAPMELYRRPLNRFVAGFIGSPQMNFLDASFETEGDRLMVRSPLFRVAVPQAVCARLRSRPERFVLGVRPHDIRYAPEKAAPSGQRPSEGPEVRRPSGVDADVRARVDMVEPRGAESFVHGVKEGLKFLASAGSDDEIESGKDADFRFNSSRFHYFDRATEESLIKE